MFTDTKSVWTEGKFEAMSNRVGRVLSSSLEITSQQIARRWRLCNPQAPSPFSNLEDEDEWRSSVLELLTKAHTLGGINELSFEVVESHYSVNLHVSHNLILIKMFAGHGISAGM